MSGHLTSPHRERVGLRHDDTGCRPDQLFGAWAIEPARFGRMVAVAKGADLAALRAEAKVAAAARGEQPLYRLTGDGLAVVEVTGPMTKYETSFQALLGGTSTVRARQAIRSAARDPEVLGIMVVFDSPGGTIAGTDDLHADIAGANARKPTWAYANGLMASAALWAGSAAGRIYASSATEIGSVGAYAVVEDTSGIYDQARVKVHVISSAPPIKGAGVDGSEITAAQLAEWERQVKDLADVFVTDLARGRRMPKERAQELATGQVWVAEAARERGLIDGVMGLDEAMALLRRQAMSEQETKAAAAALEETKKAAAASEAAREKAEAELGAMKERLAKLEAKERAARFEAEAKAMGAPAELAGILDRVQAAAGEEIYAALTKHLKGAYAQAREAGLFGERGTSQSTGTLTGAREKAMAKAAALLTEKKAADMGAALSAVFQAEPDLYAAYCRETEVAA